MLDALQSVKPGASDARTELLARILVSEQFVRAPRLQRFLTYITDCYLHNRLDEITEQQIGVHVFDKPASYNPGDDNSVRSYARTLRKRLEEYFAKEGATEPLILDVPRGGYVPVFLERQAEMLESSSSPPIASLLEHLDSIHPNLPMPGEIRSPQSETNKDAPGLRFWILVLFAFCLTSSVVAFRLGRRSGASAVSAALHVFWQGFADGKNTLLVPSDTGLTIILGLTKSSVTVPQYVTGTYISRADLHQSLPEGWANTNVHRYTDLIDVEAIASMSRLAEFPVDKTSIRYARDLRASDLKEENAILIGGANANPWVQLFDQKLNFALEFIPEGRTFAVRNRKPNPGEPSVYPYGPENWSQVSYGLIALRPSLNGKGHVLLIEGVAAAGLQGAFEYLMSESAMAQLLPQISDGQGHLRPFEILLRTNNVGANATKTEIAGFRLD